MKIGAVPINDDVARVRVVRETVGPDVKVMVDANNAYRHYQAIEFARKAEKYDLFWFEEPVEPDDYIGQREITRAKSVPVAAGENEYTRYGFRDMINHRAVDILQPDSLIMGGVTEFMKVAALAQANDLDIAPHGAQEGTHPPGDGDFERVDPGVLPRFRRPNARGDVHGNARHR